MSKKIWHLYYEVEYETEYGDDTRDYVVEIKANTKEEAMKKAKEYIKTVFHCCNWYVE